MKSEENSTFPSSLMNYLTSAIVLIQQFLSALDFCPLTYCRSFQGLMLYGFLVGREVYQTKCRLQFGTNNVLQ